VAKPADTGLQGSITAHTLYEELWPAILYDNDEELEGRKEHTALDPEYAASQRIRMRFKRVFIVTRDPWMQRKLSRGLGWMQADQGKRYCFLGSKPVCIIWRETSAGVKFHMRRCLAAWHFAEWQGSAWIS
jgi:hypothetical protein